MLKIKIPNVCLKEQIYTLDVLFNEFLGLTFDVEIYEGEVIEIIKLDDKKENSKLTLNANFFFKAHNYWLKTESMPVLPLLNWRPADDGINSNLISQTIPVLYGSPGVVKNGEHIHLNNDIFGSIFFMLSRYEEIIIKKRDNHDRFPASASVAFKANFLDRPIVNEYIEILWSCLSSKWKDLNRKKLKGSNFITCDLDIPFDPSLNFFKYALKKSFSLFIEKKILKSFKVIFLYFLSKFGFKVRDHYSEMISWIMDSNERFGNIVSFYFIAKQTSKLDGFDKFNSSKIRNLLNEIFTRGHKVGVHPGYDTFNNPDYFKKTVDEFKKILNEEKIIQNEIEGRQHYLRWNNSKTPQLYEANGLNYDTTLCYADKAGFRCGVCYEYSMYDLINRKKLKLKERPLIVMESTIISSKYESMGYSEKAFQRFLYFKKTCHQYNGTFNLLWHNNHFESKKDKEFYIQLIK